MHLFSAKAGPDPAELKACQVERWEGLCWSCVAALHWSGKGIMWGTGSGYHQHRSERLQTSCKAKRERHCESRRDSYVFQPSLTVPKLFTAFSALFIVSLLPAHARYMPQLSYIIWDPMVFSNFPPKDRLPCYFQGKYIVPCVKKCPWVKRSQSTSGEAGTCPTAMSEWAEMTMKGHWKSFNYKHGSGHWG